jgi:hypothetical protein
MKYDPNMRLDILIKKEQDYYIAHCLQFDLVATDETKEGEAVQWPVRFKGDGPAFYGARNPL